MERREFFRRGGAALSLVGLAACESGREAMAPTQASAPPPPMLVPPLAPLRASVDRIIKITVCTRPFRAQGPRLDVEKIGRKIVVHNYGHGGSGWSLSWGSSTIAAGNAMATGAKDIAVIGSGALGLTSATLLQRAGAKVTIYAKDWPPEVRSTFATGSWTPDSRICLADQATPEFKQLWERMCRTSFRIYSNYLGIPGEPVEWIDTYALTDIPFAQYQAEHEAAATIKFAKLQKELVADLTPKPLDLPAGSHPFPVPYVRRNSHMIFNISFYQRLLLADFLAAGGKTETREFHSPSDLARLRQKTIVNCTGYGARALFGDEQIVPVRGQLCKLVPQPEVTYGLSYGGVNMVPRRDGMVVQSQGIGEAEGYNDPSTEPDRAVSEQAVLTLAKLKGMKYAAS